MSLDKFRKKFSLCGFFGLCFVVVLLLHSFGFLKDLSLFL